MRWPHGGRSGSRPPRIRLSSAYSLLLAALIAPGTAGTVLADVSSDGIRTIRTIEARSGREFEIRGRRFAADGAPDTAWVPDSTRLAAGTFAGFLPVAVLQAQSGAIVAWVDGRSGDADIYAQCLSGTGGIASGWPVDGRAVCTAPRSQYQLAGAGDSTHGVVLAWTDYRDSGTSRVHAQRLLPDGSVAPGWPEDGSVVSAAGASARQPVVTADGAGGVILAWLERASGVHRIARTHLLPSGSPDQAWLANAAALGDTAHEPIELKAAPDGQGGGYLAWVALAGSRLRELRITRLDATGSVASGWTMPGTVLVAGRACLELAAAIPDGTGGVMVMWSEGEVSAPRVRLERLDGGGALAPGWEPGGVAVSTGTAAQLAPVLRSEGGGGVYVAWQDLRSGVDADIFVQRLDAAGEVASGWPDSGLAVCESVGDQRSPALLPDGAGVVVTWSEPDGDGAGGYLSRLGLSREDAPRWRSTESFPGRARVGWTVPARGAAGKAFRCHRLVAGAEWALLTTLVADRGGNLDLDDRAAPPGQTVHYRLSQTFEGGEVYFAEVAVAIPTPKPLALNGVRFGAGRRSLLVKFTLPGGERAPLAVFDVAGRRLLERDLGEFGAGDHQAEVQAPEPLAPGIYFIRLTQGAVVRTHRVSLFR